MQTSSEIRFRIDPVEREQLEQVARRLGMDVNEMVEMFIHRAIAVGGLPFDMRAPVQEQMSAPTLLSVADEIPPISGFSIERLAQISRRAFDAAYEEHVKAGRLPASSAGDDSSAGR